MVADEVPRVSGSEARRRARDLVASDGQTFAEQAGIDLTDEPAPLWQLVVLANLLSNRIRSDAAIASARELWDAGCGTPAGTRAGTWQQRVEALGRGGYRRYDFSTATRLGKNAVLVRERWGDDLRALLAEAKGAGTAKPGALRTRGAATSVSARVATLLQEFDGIGPAGARIVLREVQGVWPDVGTVVDPLVQRGAAKVGLPGDADDLRNLVGDDLPRLCAALVRVAKRR